MSEEKSTPVQEKPKKKRHLWWLNLLLALALFAGGVILGLKLPSMPLPYELVGRYFPQLTAQTEAVNTAAVTSVKANPGELTVVPQPTEAPVPTEAPKPEPTPAPEETAKPEKPEAKPEKPAEPAAEDKAEDVATVGGFDAPTGISEDAAQPDQIKPASVGLDGALKAALEHVKVRESEAEVYGVYKSVNVDTVVYVVEFATKDAEYAYLINAATGEVEGWQKTPVRWDMDGYGSFFPEDFGFQFDLGDDGFHAPAL